MDYGTYWAFLWAWINRAVGDAGHFFGWNLKTLLVPGLLLTAGFALQWKLRGISETRDDVAKFLITTAAPAIIFLAGLIVFNFLKAPYYLYTDAQEVATRMLKDSDRRLNAANQRVADTEGRLAERQVTINKLQEEAIRNKATTALGGGGPARRNLKPVRDAIAKFMEEGTIAGSACLVPPARPDLQNAAHEWGDRVYKYLQTIEAGYAARFNSAQRPVAVHTGVNQANDAAWGYVTARVQVLGTLLSEMRDQ